jgi:hypothetical protein
MRGLIGRLEVVVVPLHDMRRQSDAAQERVALDPGAAMQRREAVLALCLLVDTAAERAGDELAAEADAEHRLRRAVAP